MDITKADLSIAPPVCYDCLDNMAKNITNGLNEKQKEAVVSHQGPLLVIAGAGTGKTRTLTHRIASLIESGVPPWSILAITFTNKAAYEMKERVDHLLENTDNRKKIYERPFVSTFHSLGVKILRENATEMELNRTFAIADRERSKQIIKEAARRSGVKPTEIEPRKILAFISRQKNTFKRPEDISGFEKELDIRLWKVYEEILREESSVDFDDLLIKPLNLFEKNKAIKDHYASKWSHIHIDEYQDTNDVQCRLADILASGHGNICATGDLDQCIYSWRGARVEAILDFEKRYPKAKTVFLEQNYRSTKVILNAANNVISLNRQRKEKNLYTANEEGEMIEHLLSGSETGEASRVAGEVSELLEKGVDPAEIAVLYRTNFQSRALEEAFLSQNIPYAVIGTKFLDRSEVKDLISYIEAALNKENTSSLKRIINTPTRGIGKVTLEKFLEGREEELTGKAKENLDNFRQLLGRIEKAAKETKPSELIKFTLQESGLARWYSERKEEERIENVQELATLASKYDEVENGLEAFLEHVALYSDQDSIPTEDQKNVRLMTVHAAKGLEFQYVFITGMEEGLFPHESLSDGIRDEEEERRLFYVALTRARVKAFLSSAYVRTIFGKTNVQAPSRFIRDIGEEYLEADRYTDSKEGDGGLLSGPPLPVIN